MVQQCRQCGQMHDAYSGCLAAVRVAVQPTVVGEDEALVGNVVADRYHVGDVIGVGSTGTVFGVEHVTFARAAAMKVLRPRLAAVELVSRVFHGEARAAWSVSHPCLCEVFDIGTLPDGTPFFVMERLEGETLAARIARERLSLAAAVDVMMQMLSAIAAIHARDLLLRDLRPQNIYLAHRRGCRPLLKILDFGLARLTPLERLQEDWEALRAVVPAAQDGVGSTAIPFYLSPERTRGEHGVEPASDLFVAATIFYEALAGERPFVSSSWNGLLSQIARGRPAALHERRSDVAPELSAFVSRCLSASPRARPSSAKEMQDELRAIIEGGRKGAMPVLTSAVGTVAGAAHPEEAAKTSSSMAASPMARAGGSSASAGSAPPEGARPPSGSYERGAGSSHDMIYEDETETQRDAVQAASLVEGAIPRLTMEVAEEDDELSTAARRIDPVLHHIEPAHIDEASADSADRTVPPPPLVEVEITFDDNTERTLDLRAQGLVVLGTAEDEETETMELTPELRARVDQLMATKPAPVPVAADATKKPRRR